MTQDTEPQSFTPDRPKFLTRTRFDYFKLPEPLLSGLAEAGFEYCSPIQDQSLPIALEGRDVAGQAQTGTGKTAAFLVSVFYKLLTSESKAPGLPRALIVAPTRELATQIIEEADTIGKYTDFKTVQVVGGVDYVRQAEQLKQGCDIVVCTPGRIIDYFKQRVFKTSNIEIVVIDEADRLLDLGFAKDMRFILSKLPHYEKRQSMLYSATLSYRVLELTYDYMNLPEFVSVTPEEVTVEGIDQVLYHVGKNEKLGLLLGLLDREAWTRMLIFVNTKIGVEWLTQKLKGNQWPAEAITGDLPQKKRFRLMDQFKNGKIKILVATDVASRGIHVEDISHVINYDIPQDPENYVHRIGRTARAGKTGRAITLACEDYVFFLQPLEELLDFKIPVTWPEDDWIVEDRAGRVAIERRSPRKRPARKNGRAASRKSSPPQKSSPPRTAPSPKRVPPAVEHRPENYVPGTFFGFAADVPPQADSGDTGPSDDTEASPPRKKAPRAKRSRRLKRRRKRAPSKKQGDTGAQPPPAKPDSPGDRSD